MSAGTVSRVSLAIEIDGQAYFVVLPHDRLQLLVKMAEGLSDTGTLPVAKCPAGFAFSTMKELSQ